MLSRISIQGSLVAGTENQMLLDIQASVNANSLPQNENNYLSIYIP